MEIYIFDPMNGRELIVFVCNFKYGLQKNNSEIIKELSVTYYCVQFYLPNYMPHV